MLEDALLDVEAADEALASERDSAQIENDLATVESDTDKCPITIAGVELCTIADMMDFAINVDSELAKLTQ